MKITEIASIIHAYLGNSELWDNDGVMLESGHDVHKIAVCLDVTSANIALAKSAGADAIVTHHPLIFKPLSRLAGDSASTRIIKCIENGLSVASFHTCLDLSLIHI